MNTTLTNIHSHTESNQSWGHLNHAQYDTYSKHRQNGTGLLHRLAHQHRRMISSLTVYTVIDSYWWKGPVIELIDVILVYSY